MQSAMLFKKFLMPCGLCAAVPVMKPAAPPSDCPTPCGNDMQQKKLIKPSELPIYSVEADYSKQMPCADCPPSALELQISKVRRALQGVIVQYRDLSQTVVSKIDTGFEHSRFLLDYLQDEANVLPRIGAVGIGGLTGLVLGLRGGKFKKLTYTTIGAATVGAICYPKKAEEGFDMAKRYVNISYNFIYGVKPGDHKELEITFPELPKLKMPSSYSEFLDLAVDTGSAAASAVSTLADKVLKAVTDKKEETQPADESGTK